MGKDGVEKGDMRQKEEGLKEVAQGLNKGKGTRTRGTVTQGERHGAADGAHSKAGHRAEGHMALCARGTMVLMHTGPCNENNRDKA